MSERRRPAPERTDPDQEGGATAPEAEDRVEDRADPTPHDQAANAEVVPDPDAATSPEEHSDAARRHAERLERHSERPATSTDPATPGTEGPSDGRSPENPPAR